MFFVTKIKVFVTESAFVYKCIPSFFKNTPLEGKIALNKFPKSTNMSGDSDSDIGVMVTSFQAKSLAKTCAWCKNCKSLLSGKLYCSDCSVKMYKECSHCHLPYPEMKYFKLDKQRCNTCQRKYLIEKEKRLQKLKEQKQHPKGIQTEEEKNKKKSLKENLLKNIWNLTLTAVVMRKRS